GDISEPPPAALLQMGAEALGGEARLFDVVISDMAPNTSGAGSSDHFLSVRLCDRVLEMLPRVLKGGGKCAMKVFEGEAYKDLLDRTGEMFAEVKGFKPKASRDVSREMYIVAAGFRAVLA
ncbi:MAG: RlmE family RNA methyltransferase, partial [Planctomycetota bacterium]|nr:RlmE family RNA methyltransferase [Planctomycetota bacterium]